MKKKKTSNDIFSQFISGVYLLTFGVVAFSLSVLIYSFFSDCIDKSIVSLTSPSQEITNYYDPVDLDKVEKGIHVATGLAYDENFQLVKDVCTSCHSAKLITQNKATRDGWKDMLRWMQKTQGLPDLGKSEVHILDYLETHYAPVDVGRRKPIDIDAVEWYVLKEI